MLAPVIEINPLEDPCEVLGLRRNPVVPGLIIVIICPCIFIFIVVVFVIKHTWSPNLSILDFGD